MYQKKKKKVMFILSILQKHKNKSITTIHFDDKLQTN